MQNFLRLTIIFLLTILVATALSFASWQLWQRYQYERRQKANAAQKTLEQTLTERIQNDNWGGRTPKETLSMFIEAVERNDLDSASRYFIAPTQAENLKILQAARVNGKTAALLNAWKKLLQNKDLADFKNQEFFRDPDYPRQQDIYNNKEFLAVDNFESDNPTMAVFRVYPRGAWKIRGISMNI